MPKIAYKNVKFHRKSLKLIELANKICNEYASKGYILTLRQIYYQFVARDWFPEDWKWTLVNNKWKRDIINGTKNATPNYKNLGNMLNDARLAGLIDWEHIEDRARSLEGLPFWHSPKDILKASANQFRYDYWKDQDFRIEVRVEKDAIAGIVERVAFKYRCQFSALRGGYSSQSEMWRAGLRYQDYNNKEQYVKILYLGDHDPSGIDMTRDNSERLNLFSNYGDIEVIRLALNEDQVYEYNPPPNPAKLTDTRAPDYIAKFGESSWELDALDPEVIDKIISDEIEKYIDWDKWEKVKEREQEARKQLLVLADNWKDSSQN